MRRPSVLLAGLLGVVLAAAPAAAQTVTSLDRVVDELAADQVYVDSAVDVPSLDESDLRDEVLGSDVQLYVAVVPAELAEREGGTPALVQSIGETIGDSNAAVLVITDEPDVYADQGSALGARGVNAGAAVRQNNDARSFDAASIEAFVGEVADTLDAQAAGGARPGTAPSGGGSAPAATGLLPLLVVGGLGLGGYALFRGRRNAREDQQALEDARADVESLYGRLGSDVQLLYAGDDPVAQQALADASERYNATGALMAKADTLGEYAAARRTAVEGLAAASVVRERIGLDPGPEVPPPPGAGPQLEAPTRVQVGDEEYDGAPRYEPGRPHYFEGGYYGGQQVPGGWYATPFWHSVLLGSVLSGGRRHRRGHYGGMGGGMGGFGGGIGGGTVRTRGGSLGRRSGGGGSFGGFGGGGGWGGGRRSGGGWGGGGGRRGGGGGGW